MINPAQFSDHYQPQFGFPHTEPLSLSRLELMTTEQLLVYQNARKEAAANAERNPVGAGWTLPMWDLVMSNWKKYSVIVILGGIRCVRGDTLIYDPVLRRSRRIDSIQGEHHVYAWDGQKVVIARAAPPFPKGHGRLLRITLSNGVTFVAAPEHRVLCADGRWLSCDQLQLGCELFPLPSSAGPGQSVHAGAVMTKRWEANDVKWDMTVPAHENYIVDGVVHHNSTKTTFASRLTLWAAGTIPEAEIRAYHVNEERSVDQQQAVFEALPLNLRNLPAKKGMFHSLQYTQKNGFTDKVCILPPHSGRRRGGVIKFGNYSQYRQDPQVTEGFKSHLIWGDEEMPPKMFETLIYRTTDYHGRIILTFTTLQGWSPLIQDILGKVRTIKRAKAPLLNNREVPIMQESLSRPGTVIYYFHTMDNVFIDTQDFMTKLRGRPAAEVLARAYGIPTKAVAGVFPAFNREVNVVPHEELPFVKKRDDHHVTRYMAIDPGGSKNWFMLWVAIDASGTWWVYREWPDHEEWALPGNTVEGKPGPAQKGSGKGIKDYVELIRDMEKGEEIYERIIDPRMGAAERQAADGATTIISDLDDQGMTVLPAPGGSTSSGKGEIEDGLQLINNLLAWNEAKPRDAVNLPHLYISDRCQNLIYAMAEYTNKGGPNENTKDPIDCLRFLRKASCTYLEPGGDAPPNRTGCY